MRSLLSSMPFFVGCALFAIAACGDDDAATPSSDAGPQPAERGADAGVGAGPTFCTPQTADFCGDFDRGPTPGTGWTGVGATGGGALALEAATETSKPNVLKASLPALDGTKGNAATAQVAKQAISLAGKKKINIALRANLGDSKPGGQFHLVSFLTVDADVGKVALFRGQDRSFVSIARRNTGAEDVTESQLLVPPALGKWIKVDLEIVLARPN